MSLLRTIGLVGLPSLLVGKAYGWHKYQGYKRQRERQRAGVGVGPARFAGLSRVRQRSLLAYRRRQVRELENVYYAQSPRRRIRY